MAITFPGNPHRRRPAPNPGIAHLLAALRASRYTRRSFLRSSGVLTGGAVLAACGISGEAADGGGGGGGGASAAPAPSSSASAGAATGDQVVDFANWPLYIDTGDDEQTHPTLDRFTEETGIAVNYFEDINSNEEYFAQVRNQLDAGEPIGRDLMVLTDWMAGRLLNLGWIQEIDMANIPNSSNLLPSLADVAFDPERSYSLPWQSGLTGIGVNPTAVDSEITSVEDLFDPKLAGRVTMLSELRDTTGLLMAGMGIDPADHTFAEFESVMTRLQKAVDDGQIRQFTGNEYATDLAAGNIAAAIAWSGDVIQLQFDNPDLQFVVPDQGSLLWSDNMLIPNNAAHKANAETLMNFYYQPDVAAEVAAWVNYITPVDGAKQAMEQVDPELVDFELIFPPEELLGNTFDFMTLDEDQETQYQEAFQRVIGA